MIAVLALVVIVLQAAQNFLAAPIKVGKVLPPGTKRSKCGILSFLPAAISPCENSFLEVTKEGTVTLSNNSGDITMLAVGGVCKKENCVPGILVGKDGIVTVGGRRVKAATVYGSKPNVAPWPFQEAPKMKIKSQPLK